MFRPARPLSLLLAALAATPPLPVRAQKPEPAPPAAAPRAAPADLPLPEPPREAPDPPARVARLARLAGEAQLRPAGSEDWQPAPLNLPLIAGQALATAPSARALLQLGQTRMAMEGGSVLELTWLEESALHATLGQGTLDLAIPALLPEETLRLTTPRGEVRIATAGRYGLTAQEGGNVRLAVFKGTAEFLVENQPPVTVAQGQAVVLDGIATRSEDAGPQTPLMAWSLAEENRRPLPPSVRGMTGADDLGRWGEWQQSPEHGDIWIPPVEPGWVPYRQGAWRWVEPWGWTWVDQAPWGFAPFHYGRWFEWNGGWAWAPAPWRVLPPPIPVYAPALVVFLRNVAPGRIGWVPLGPRDPYVPAFWASQQRFRAYNHHLSHYSAVEAAWRADRWAPPPGLHGRPGGSHVPTGVMLGGAAVAGAAAGFAAAHWAAARGHALPPVARPPVHAAPRPAFGAPPAPLRPPPAFAALPPKPGPLPSPGYGARPPAFAAPPPAFRPPPSPGHAAPPPSAYRPPPAPGYSAPPPKPAPGYHPPPPYSPPPRSYTSPSAPPPRAYTPPPVTHYSPPPLSRPSPLPSAPRPSSPPPSQSSRPHYSHR